MHDDVYLTKDIVKPEGEITIVYFSSRTGNTKRFVEKTEFKNFRIPMILSDDTITVLQDYVLVCPTYSAGGNDTKGAVPKQVIKFLNVEGNRKRCKGVIATGNTNFGNTYCIAGPILSNKLGVPLLFQLELVGTQHDVNKTKEILNNFWKNNGEKND